MKRLFTIFGAILFASFVLSSCGPVDPNKGACNCQDIVGNGRVGLSKKDGKLYTGLCIKKDKNDSVVQRIEFKNGFISKQQGWVEVYGNYVLCAEVTAFADAENIKDGWELELKDNEEISPCKYVTKRKEYVDGKELTYQIVILNGSKDQILIGFQIYSKNGNGVINKEEKHPSFLKEYFDINNGFWIVGAKNSTEGYAALDNLKKELPWFNYWKQKKI